jgi:phage terminase large subunit
MIPNDEKLIAQLTSRRKLYDSKGRERLESKADLRARGVESPERADALIGSIVLGQQVNFDWQEELEGWKRIKRQMELGIGSNAMFPRRHIDWRR